MDLQILISILWLSCSVQGQQEPDVIITSSEPSIGKVLRIINFKKFNGIFGVSGLVVSKAIRGFLWGCH